MLQLLKPLHLEPVLRNKRGPCTATKSGPCSPQLEKARAQKQRPNAAKKKEFLTLDHERSRRSAVCPLYLQNGRCRNGAFLSSGSSSAPLHTYLDMKTNVKTRKTKASYSSHPICSLIILYDAWLKSWSTKSWLPFMLNLLLITSSPPCPNKPGSSLKTSCYHNLSLPNRDPTLSFFEHLFL